MTVQPLLACPRGGCDAYGYCPCAEDEPPDEDALRLVEALAAGRAAIVGGRIRGIETLPPIDTYQPTKDA